MAALAALIAATGLLTACGPPPTTAGWQPPAPAAPEAAIALRGSGAGPSAPGLDPRLLFAANPKAAVGARWEEIPGVEPFNAELRSLVRAALDAQSGETGVPY